MASIVIDMTELKEASDLVRQAVALDHPDDVVLWGFLQSRCGEDDLFRTVRTGQDRYRLEVSKVGLDVLAAVRAGELERREFDTWHRSVTREDEASSGSSDCAIEPLASSSQSC